MATGMSVSLDPFSGQAEHWPLWEMQFKSFLFLNKVTDETAVHMLCIHLHPDGLQRLIDLCRPRKVTEVKHEDLLKLLSQYYTPEINEVMASYRFFRCVQTDGQSITQYVAELRKAASLCNFDSPERVLRDMFVQGIKSDAIRQRLLADPKLTFDTAVQKALASEAAARDAQEMAQTATVHRIDRESRSTKDVKARGKEASGQCKRCGRRGHRVNDCRMPEDIVCHHCHKPGHVARACPKIGSDDEPTPSPSPTRRKKGGDRINHVSMDWAPPSV